MFEEPLHTLLLMYNTCNYSGIKNEIDHKYGPKAAMQNYVKLWLHFKFFFFTGFGMLWIQILADHTTIY